MQEELLGDTGVLTQNPWEANLFVLPTYSIFTTGNIGQPALLFDRWAAGPAGAAGFALCAERQAWTRTDTD